MGRSLLVTCALLALPLSKRLLAVEQIKSTFVRAIVNGAKKRGNGASQGRHDT